MCLVILFVVVVVSLNERKREREREEEEEEGDGSSYTSMFISASDEQMEPPHLKCPSCMGRKFSFPRVHQ